MSCAVRSDEMEHYPPAFWSWHPGWILLTVLGFIFWWPVGLAILATEYAWARRWLRKVRRIASDVVSGRKRTSIRDLVSSSHRGEQEKRAASGAER